MSSTKPATLLLRKALRCAHHAEAGQQLQDYSKMSLQGGGHDGFSQPGGRIL